MVKTKDLRAMSLDELESKLVECKKEQFNLRIQQSTGQLQNTAQLAKVRKEVAKINSPHRHKRYPTATSFCQRRYNNRSGQESKAQRNNR